MKLDHIKACQKSLLLVYQKLIWAWHRGQKVKFCPKFKIFGNNLEIAIFDFFDFLPEVRTLKALQTGIEIALSKYLFYGQLRGQKVYVCLEFCPSHFLSGSPLVPRGLLICARKLIHAKCVFYTSML